METLFYDQLKNGQVRCRICNHFCKIENGQRGICQVRENQGGRLIFLAYSKVISTSVDPIEKKPIFHLKPGSTSFSIATPGCNFQCTFCQNHQIAQMPKDNNGMIQGRAISPDEIVKAAIKSGCESISYTYTEPTIYYELAVDTARLAKQKGLYNIFVTNGYMSDQVLDSLSGVIDAANVDLKSFDPGFYQHYCQANLAPVKKNLKKMKKMGMLVEITTLLIPGLNDQTDQITQMAKFIANDLGEDTPWHISRFHPCYQMMDRPVTPSKNLEQAYQAGKDAGLKYVYIGNLPGQSKENTTCHACGHLLVGRVGYQVTVDMGENSDCPECHAPVYGIY